MKKLIAIVVAIVGLLLVGSRLYNRHGRTEAPVDTARALGSGAARDHASRHDSTTAHIVISVTDEGGPVANAIVRCAPVDGDVVVLTTASDGGTSIDLAPGQWSIAASADGHEPAAATLDVIAARDDRVRLVLATGGRTLTGIVTDATGGPIAGARIDAARLRLHTQPERAVAVAFSDPAGRYQLTLGGGAIFVAASHREYAAQTRYIDLGANGASADFALVPGGVIEGIVRDSQTMRPVAGAAVRAKRDSSALELAEASECVVKTDDAGRFRFAGLRPASYDLFAREGARSSRAPVGVGLGVAEQQADVVVLIGAAATLRGKVVDETGAPASSVTVRASVGRDSDAAISDAAGAFVFEGLSPGRWALRGASERYISDGQAIVPLKRTDIDGVVVRVRELASRKRARAARTDRSVLGARRAADLRRRRRTGVSTPGSGANLHRVLHGRRVCVRTPRSRRLHDRCHIDRRYGQGDRARRVGRDRVRRHPSGPEWNGLRPGRRRGRQATIRHARGTHPGSTAGRGAPHPDHRGAHDDRSGRAISGRRPARDQDTRHSRPHADAEARYLCRGRQHRRCRRRDGKRAIVVCRDLLDSLAAYPGRDRRRSRRDHAGQSRIEAHDARTCTRAPPTPRTRPQPVA